MDSDKPVTTHTVWSGETKPPSPLPIVGGGAVLRKSYKLEEIMNCFSFPPHGPSVSVPPQEEIQDSPSAWRCESWSCSPPYCTKNGVPTAYGQSLVAREVSGASSNPCKAGQFPSLLISQRTFWSLSSSFRGSEEPQWALVLLSSISVSSGWHSIISASCSLGGDLLLESSPVSVVMFETDFGSRLVGWGDKTLLCDTCEQNARNIF